MKLSQTDYETFSDAPLSLRDYVFEATGWVDFFQSFRYFSSNAN